MVGASYVKTLTLVETGGNQGCGKPKVGCLPGEGDDSCLHGEIETSEIA
jgi:hypothetical protein